MRAPVWTAIAMALGLIVLLGYFIPPEMAELSFILNVRSVLVGWAVILAAVASIVGIINLVLVHFRRATAKRDQDPYSYLLLLAFAATAVGGIVMTPADPNYQKVVTAIQVPIEASLMGILVITLTYASLRLFQRRKGVMVIVFAASALIFLLLGSGLLVPLMGVPLIGDLLAFFQRLPVAGSRGILLGIALGSLVTGLRILVGADRPYSG
jgi:hypothetical protein